MRFELGFRRSLGDALHGLGLDHVLLLMTPEIAGFGADIMTATGDRRLPRFAGVEFDAPIAATEAALAIRRESGANEGVSVGSGSAIGLGKALSVRSGLPYRCLPTP